MIFVTILKMKYSYFEKKKMKNLLLATDFSDPSLNAYKYALHLSKVLKTGLTVLYVAPSSEEHFFDTEALNQKLMEVDKEKYEKALKRFVNKCPSSFHVNYLYKKGEVVVEIIKTAQDINSDLVLIGTRHKHNLWNHLFGSLSTDLIKESPISVLVIPHQVTYQSIKNIAYANALQLDGKFPQKTIQDFAKSIDANVQFVHIDLDASEEATKKEKSSVFYQSSNPLKSMTIVRDDSVSGGLNYFLEHHQVDLLVMSLSRQEGLNQFFHISQTKKMVYQTKFPLLICKK